MESEWRYGVWRNIGPTYAHWDLPLGVPVQIVLLCARLNPAVSFNGKVWTHVLRVKTPGSANNTAFARIQGGGNVLNEVFLFFLPGPFPHGFAVDPDH